MTDKDPWKDLGRYTDARIVLGRAGGSLTTSELLRFRRDHALARDAVLADLNLFDLENKLGDLGLAILKLKTRAETREEYIRRPDLGRVLQEESTEDLKKYSGSYDLGVVLADGLSAIAIERNAPGFLKSFLPETSEMKIAPVCIVRHGRVALSDEIGELLGCRMIIMLIGERPGLSSPDSMGIYMTYNPLKGNTDEMRNCISNIRTGGLPVEFASEKLIYLINESFRKKLSGVNLKDNFGQNPGLT